LTVPKPRKPRAKPQKPHPKHPKAPETKATKGDRTEFRPAVQPGYPDALDLDEGRR